MATGFQVTFDCADPDRLARFWTEVLGYQIQDPPGRASCPGRGIHHRLIPRALERWNRGAGSGWRPGEPGDRRAPVALSCCLVTAVRRLALPTCGLT